VNMCEKKKKKILSFSIWRKLLKTVNHTYHFHDESLLKWDGFELPFVDVSTFKVIHLVICHTTCPKPLPKRVLHIVRSTASSFK